MFPPSTKMIITSSMSSQEKMKLKPTPLPGQKCHQHQHPCGPAVMLALPPAEPRGCMPLIAPQLWEHHPSQKLISVLPSDPRA